MNKLARRTFLTWAAGVPVMPALSRIAGAETYPSRPVKIIVPVPPGGALDINARLMGQWLSDHMGQPFVIENRPGAGTNLGVEAVARAQPDGYTLLLIPQSVTTNATLYQHLSFDFIRDIVPIAMISSLPLVMLVNLDNPAKTVPEFIAWAKANSGKVNMASGGTGSASHIGGEFFKTMTGVDMLHVPYKGGAPAITDLMGGTIQVYFSPLPESIGVVKGGKVRALAITTAKRVASLPEYPPSANPSRASRSAPGRALARLRTRPPRLLPRSIRRSMRGLPIRRSRPASSNSAASRRRSRPPISRSGSSMKRRAGPR